MQEIIPDVALLPALKQLVKDDVRYHLFTNDVTPDTATVLGDLTEAAWTFYASILLIASEWIENDPVNGVGMLLHPPITFGNDTGGDIQAYGYYRTDALGNLMGVCRFDGAPIIKHDGEAFVLIPILGDVMDQL